MLFADLPVVQVADESVRKIAVTLIVAAVSSAASFYAGRWWGRYKAGRQWSRKEFFGRVNVSLNLFADGALHIRTVLERSLEEVFLNDVAVAKVLSAAYRCTHDRPLLPLAPADRWYLLNFVLNAVAEVFAVGQVRRDAGLPVTRVKYLLFLTCEVVGEERIRKVRAMLVKEDVLKSFPYPDALPALENPWHKDRIKTLRLAAEAYAKEPDQFLPLEVCV